MFKYWLWDDYLDSRRWMQQATAKFDNGDEISVASDTDGSCEWVDWIKLDQDMILWWSFVTSVMNLRDLKEPLHQLMLCSVSWCCLFCDLRVRLSLQFFTHRNVNVSSFARVYLERAKLPLKFNGNRLLSYLTRWSSFFFLSYPFHAFNYFPYFISTFSLDILEVLLKSAY
jgi:hypothetical protein